MAENISRICWHCKHGQFSGYSNNERATTNPLTGVEGICIAALKITTVIEDRDGAVKTVKQKTARLSDRAEYASKIIRGNLTVKTGSPCRVKRRWIGGYAFKPIPNINPPQQKVISPP